MSTAPRDDGLADKVAVITGGASGIGRAPAVELAPRGIRVNARRRASSGS